MRLIIILLIYIFIIGGALAHIDAIEHDLKELIRREDWKIINIKIDRLERQLIECEKTTLGEATFYDYTLNGEWYSKENNTAASRDFKRKTHLLVTNTDNNKSVEVVVNDYGPQEWTGREIDLSSHAFATIAPLSLGVIKVKIREL